MSERKEGWYWVRLANGAWVIGHYHGIEIWRLTSSIVNYYDKDFLEIGPHVPEPE